MRFIKSMSCGAVSSVCTADVAYRYTADNTVTHPERFLVVQPDAGPISPLSGSPLVKSRRLSEAGRDEESASADSTRHGSYGQLALAFVNSRTPGGRQASGTSRRSFDASYGSRVPLHHHNSQDLGVTTPTTEPAVTPPLTETETSGTATPFPGPVPAPQDNQDPGIPNIELGGYESDRARYQSGMTVSSSQRADQVEHAIPPNWASPAAHEQRDLARLLGQSKARLIEPLEVTGEGEGEGRVNGDVRGARGSESTEAGQRPSTNVNAPQGDAEPPSPRHGSTTLPDGPTTTEPSTGIFPPKPLEPGTEPLRPRTTFAARDGPIQRVTAGTSTSGAHRAPSDTSDDMQRYDVPAREKAEARRLRTVWEEKGHLTAPKQAPGDVRRRLKAM